MVNEAEYAARFERRLEAYLNGYCCRCGREVNPSDLDVNESADWEARALCPVCAKPSAKKGADCNE